MASNMLMLPFRQSPAISLAQPIRQYISHKYDQHPEIFNKDIEVIDQLRVAAVQSNDAHVTGIIKLQSYAAQLVWISGKFPIDIGVEFPWYPSIGYNTSRPDSKNSIKFELANILFNLAALYSQLGINSRATVDGLKTACNYYSMAAGVIHHLQSSIIPDMMSTAPEEMDTLTLECLEQLMLAQAQECVWQKAVMDRMKDLTIAKVAAKVSDYYAVAADFGSKSEIIRSEWIHHMKAKHFHFAAAAQYRGACDALEKRKYGEEIARLRDSQDCAAQALKESKYINKAVLNDLNALKERVQEDLKRAEKDNDVIYLNVVPSKVELKQIDPIAMVSAKIPVEVKDPISLLGDNEPLGKPLFTKLVPYAVHVAAEAYQQRRDRLINQSVIEELENLTVKLHDLLKSLNLPGALQAVEKPLGLPPGLMSHAEEIRQQDGPSRLQRAIQETEKVKANDRNIFQEGIDLLRSESTEDERLRRKYGTERWTRPVAEEVVPKLYAQTKEVQGYFDHSYASDELVLKKLTENERLILLLAGNDRDLEGFVPSSRRAAMTPALEGAANKLRASLSEASRMEGRRKRKGDALLSRARQDDINSELIREAARLEREHPMQKIEVANFEQLFERRLEVYLQDRDMVTQESADQDRLAAKLVEANSAFNQARKGDTSTKEREKALQSLENAYFKYKEIITNLEAARKFYNDLAKIVVKFRDECRGFSYQRRADATQLEAELVSGMSALNLDTAASLQQQKRQQASSTTNKKPNDENQVPLTAPQPKRVPSSTNQSAPAGMWNPDIGIRFGGAPAPAAGGPGNGQEASNGTEHGSKDGKWSPSKGLKFS